MGHTLDVFVVDEDDCPVKGKRVRIWIAGFWKGGAIEDFTDQDGHVEFETSDDYEGARELFITVNQERFGPYRIRDGRWTVQI